MMLRDVVPTVYRTTTGDMRLMPQCVPRELRRRLRSKWGGAGFRIGHRHGAGQVPSNLRVHGLGPSLADEECEPASTSISQPYALSLNFLLKE